MWSAEIRDTQSGALCAPVKVVGRGAWGRGDLLERTTSIQLHDKFTRDQWHEIVLGPSDNGWDRTLCYLWDGKIVYAGLILDAPGYDRNSRVLTIMHNDLSVLLARRWMHGVGTSGGEGGYQRGGAFSVSGVSVAGAVNRVLRQAYVDAVALPSWPVPVDFPAVSSGGFAKTWKFYEFQNAEAIVRSLTDRDDGPDLDLQPKLSGGLLRWDQRIGDLTGPTIEINLGAQKSAAADAGFGRYGRDTATGIHYPGKGQDEDMRVGAAFLPVSAGLARDSIFWNKTEPSVTRLVAEANGRMSGLASAVTRRPVTVKARDLDPSAVRIGSPVIIHSADKLWEPEKSTYRVVGFSGLVGETYDLELQEA